MMTDRCRVAISSPVSPTEEANCEFDHLFGDSLKHCLSSRTWHNQYKYYTPYCKSLSNYQPICYNILAMESQKNTMKAELILPGGDINRVKVAFSYGADAVYIGLDKYSLRKAGVNFTLAEIKEAIDYAHTRDKKIYITFNIFAHNQHLSEVEAEMKEIASFGPDAFIIADVGVIRVAKRVAPNIPLHISTQANTVNSEDVKFWRDYGVKRIVLARELTLDEIKEIHKEVPDIELEAFVHGAMCISYSGRCLLSNYMTGRHANLGECAQPCRWNYSLHSDKRPVTGDQEKENYYLEEKLRPGELFKIEESNSGTTIMSSKDLRLIRYLPEMLDAGIVGLKIEGRNKTEYYLATAALAYSEALKLTKEGKYTEKDKERLEKELEKLNYRDYTTGFIFGDAILGQTYDARPPVRNWDYVGQVTNNNRQLANEHEVIVKNKITKGDEVEVLTPNGIKKDKVIEIQDLSGEVLPEVNPGKENQKAIITLQNEYSKNSMIRKEATKS